MSNEINIKKDQDLEKSILGAILIDSKCLDNEHVSMLRQSDFMYENNRIVFNAIKERHSAGLDVDLVVIRSLLREKNQLEKIGGSYFLTGLFEDDVTTAHISTWAKELIKNRKHNDMIKVIEKFRMGKVDRSILEEFILAEREKEYTESDYGNAEMLGEMFSDKIRYNHDTGEWLLWDGTFWKPDKTNGVQTYAMQVARKRQNTAVMVYDRNNKKRRFEFGLRSEDGHMIQKRRRRTAPYLLGRRAISTTGRF